MSAAAVFDLDVVAEPADIDSLGHVSNLVYLRWALQAAEAHSSARGYDLAAYRNSGRVFVVRRHEVDYLLPAMAGDRIRLSTWVESFRAASCLRKCDIRRASDAAVLARVSTTWAYVSFESGKPERIPAALAGCFVAG